MAATAWKPAPPRVVIVGGGLAGLATAAALVGRDLEIILLESRPRLGGRAGSFTDPIAGDLVDNCQHVSMGCCTNLADFAVRAGVAGLFRREPGIVFLGPDNRVSELFADPLPAPFHLARGFWGLKFLSFWDKVGIARALLSLAWEKSPSPTESFADWLKRHRQSPAAIELYWSVVLVSALNEQLERMDIGHARKVFVEGFLAHPEGSTLEIPTVPLGELYGTRVEDELRSRGVDLRLKTGVKAIEIDAESSIVGVTLRNGDEIKADFVVSAVPFDRVRELFANEAIAAIPKLDAIATMDSSPITGIHLWFDRPVCPLPHAVLTGRTVQWVFNHTKLQGRGLADGSGEYLQLVISASRSLTGMDNRAILELALGELRAIWPAVGEAELVRFRVVTEHGATFTVSPGIEAKRPAQRTPIAGLYLAGDWTDTGWPATMEGAVRSGYLAAEGILDDLGAGERILKPDLKPSAPARLIFGLKPSYRAAPGSAKLRPLLEVRHIPAE